MQNLRKGIKEITNTSNRFLSALRGASTKKFIWLIVGYFIVLTYAGIFMPSVIQAFSQETQGQGSEIEIRSLYFNVVSTEDFVKRLSVNPPPNNMTVCEKKKPELISCVNILVPAGDKKTSNDTDQCSDNARKSDRNAHEVSWSFGDTVSLLIGALIGTALAVWLMFR